MNAFDESEYGHTTFHSEESPLAEFSDRDGSLTVVGADNVPRDAKYFLAWMQMRIAVYGAPLPDDFVPPPGIDIAALLRQVPWPPTE